MATTKTIQSVERAFSILEYLQQCGGGERSVKEIADALELNKSTAFGLINTLTTLGYLQQNADNQKYVLSLKLLSFSNTIKVQNSIIRTVHPYLEQISLKYGEIAHCGVAQGDSVFYVDKVESSRSLSINTQIGTKNYLHCTGVGKCILAYMPEDEQQHILAGPLKALTFNTIVDPPSASGGAAAHPGRRLRHGQRGGGGGSVLRGSAGVLRTGAGLLLHQHLRHDPPCPHRPAGWTAGRSEAGLRRHLPQSLRLSARR